MNVETEVKLEVADANRVLERLRDLKMTRVAPRHFEDNYVLDGPGGEVRGSGCLLRLRMTPDAAILTYKGAARPDGPFKSREEIETRVQDGGRALEIFIRLGYRVAFRYQKYREEYEVPSLSSETRSVHVALDETPVGTFMEIEGEESDIRWLAGKLGFRESQFIRDSYYVLYTRFCRERGLSPGHMVYEY